MFGGGADAGPVRSNGTASAVGGSPKDTDGGGFKRECRLEDLELRTCGRSFASRRRAGRSSPARFSALLAFCRFYTSPQLVLELKQECSRWLLLANTVTQWLLLKVQCCDRSPDDYLCELCQGLSVGAVACRGSPAKRRLLLATSESRFRRHIPRPASVSNCDDFAARGHLELRWITCESRPSVRRPLVPERGVSEQCARPLGGAHFPEARRAGRSVRI